MKFQQAIPQFNAWLSFGKRESTRGTYRVQVMQFALYMHNCQIEDVDLQDVLNYLTEAQNLGWDPNNFLAKTSAIKKFFEFFKKQGITYLEPDLIPIMEGIYRFPKVAKIEDYEKVLSIIPRNNDPRHIRNLAMLMVYKDSGMRLSENLSLDMGNVDTDKLTALVQTEKTKHLHPIRRVFWTEETNKQLKKWIKVRERLINSIEEADKQALWIATQGKNLGRRLKKNGVTEILRRYSHKAGLKTVLNSHSLRHLFGRDLAEQNASDANIATMMGHASVDSSRPYTIMSSDKMAQFYANYKKKPVKT